MVLAKLEISDFHIKKLAKKFLVHQSKHVYKDFAKYFFKCHESVISIKHLQIHFRTLRSFLLIEQRPGPSSRCVHTS